MKRLPERWTLLRAGAPVFDELTNNRIPAAPTEIPWWGLLQKRDRVAVQDEEFDDGHVGQRLTLLLMPGIPGGVNRRDVWRFDGPAEVSDIVAINDTVTVQGTPRTRRPAIGRRTPAYIAAIVRHSSDLRE